MIEIKWDPEGRKCTKKAFLRLLWLFDSLVYTRKSFKHFKPPSYMTTHVRHLKTEFADDPTDPAQLVGSQAKYEFLGFFSEKNNNNNNNFWDLTRWRHIFCTSQGLKSFLLWPSTIEPTLVQIQKGFPDFQKTIPWEAFKRLF